MNLQLISRCWIPVFLGYSWDCPHDGLDFRIKVRNVLSMRNRIDDSTANLMILDSSVSRVFGAACTMLSFHNKSAKCAVNVKLQLGCC